MNLYAATTILFLSSAQAQQIQSPTAALTTYVPTEGSAEAIQIQPMNSLSMSMQTAQVIEAFGYGSKSSKTGGHGYGGYGAYDSKSAKKGSGYSSGSSAKGGKTGGSGDGYGSGSDSKSAKGGHGGYGGYGGYGGGGYGAAIEVPLQQSTFEIDETSATPAVEAKGGKTGGSYDGDSYGDSKSAKGSGYGSAKSGKGGYSAVASTVEVEETSAPDVPVPDVDIDEIVGYLSSFLVGLLDDVEGQADADKPAAFNIDAIYDAIGHFLNGYGSKSSKSKSGKRF